MIRRMLSVGAIGVTVAACILTVLCLRTDRGKYASELPGEPTVELVANAVPVVDEPMAPLPSLDANLEASDAARDGHALHHQDDGRFPMNESAPSLSERAPSSSIPLRLASAKTHEEMGEIAATIAASGARDDILALFAAIETAEVEDRDTLARSLQALSGHDMGADLLNFLIRNASDPTLADQARDALARIIAPEDIALISQAVPSDPEQSALRSYLVQALAQVRNPASVEALVNLCAQSKDQDVVNAASSALGSIGTEEAVMSLVSLIEDAGIQDLNDPLAQALMSAANKDSRVLLQEEFLNTTNPVIQYATAYALTSLANQGSEDRSGTASEQP